MICFAVGLMRLARTSAAIVEMSDEVSFDFLGAGFAPGVTAFDLEDALATFPTGASAAFLDVDLGAVFASDFAAGFGLEFAVALGAVLVVLFGAFAMPLVPHRHGSCARRYFAC